VRDKDKPKAREILSSLRDEFPNNPLFSREIARFGFRQPLDDRVPAKLLPLNHLGA